jgi:hypothetical protein
MVAVLLAPYLNEMRPARTVSQYCQPHIELSKAYAVAKSGEADGKTALPGGPSSAPHHPCQKCVFLCSGDVIG